ncbi:membrane protein insertion efficiency factor YidD [Bacteriovorax antarcticus]|uniref:membrane protein insertion efficiency factor YidD n=1 Tax=Bacteriovorax antarcticus TaxID=3088717 RepID=UPI00396AF4A3
MKFIFLGIIRFYRYFISPLFGPKCRFYPSCSLYSKECFERFPIGRAVWYSCRRISRCHPFCEGGHDPVPEE